MNHADQKPQQRDVTAPANRSAPSLLAIVGRPNVGKSTLFNRLLARRRSITDPTPGVTRDVVEEEAQIAGVTVRLLDTGGVGGSQDSLGQAVGERALNSVIDATAVLWAREPSAGVDRDPTFNVPPVPA